MGHTGFVGSNLHRQAPFDACYNSSNIESIEGRSFELLACAGAPGLKWKANQEPDEDRASLDRLMRSLGEVSARHVILISTVDVYPSPVGVDEETPIPDGAGAPYGQHRFVLERFVRDRFESTIVRLPGLFGTGLRKNVIYDLLHDHRVEAIAPESVHQFYGIETLWDDIDRMRRHGIALMNFATEPVSVREIAREAFGRELGGGPSTAARYDVRTLHDRTFGGSGGYIRTRCQVLSALRDFVAGEMGSAAGP